MKKFLWVAIALSSIFGTCEKDPIQPSSGDYGNGAKTPVPPGMQGNWMYGNFSMTEYWSRNPAEYLGNAFEMAIAFKLNANGTYEQYFTSKTVTGIFSTYHQSLTKGTIEIDEAAKAIITHAHTAHYRQTKNGQITEDRDLDKGEITANTNYSYELKTEANGTKAIYLRLNGNGNALQFLQKF